MTKVLGSKRIFSDITDDECMEFLNSVSSIVQIDAYQQLKNYTHHYYTTRYQHSLNVAWYSYLMCKKMHLNAVSCARGAMMHDFYLYDTHDAKYAKKHIQTHPSIALKNAQKYFVLDPVEVDCIIHHMWPRVKGKPRTKEGYIVTIAAKYAASLEVCSHPFYALPAYFKKIF